MRWMGYQLRYGKLELMELGPPVDSRLDLTGTMTCRTVQQKERPGPRGCHAALLWWAGFDAGCPFLLSVGG
jgi:hypothetical protein